ncbi:four-carbon acid sugar kinase family protein [Mucilaginibacter sp. KACC 22773]|uniref:four-carbon acid sugar kinase family protein n=1 Tax=Mucilaginibacter sp. KACC 22773 TaxID=3025671 RepID=UPI00236515C3|nr:four-carbon acid sugar kinase family protein [Mucilaginibacter sp. KACC 22773]WDF81359.1 four-carbon acid sugar kinase family protein [Mucilaginibacter sp. KACC 22773]
MIAVIADDLTGAAELAGIGLGYQLKTEVSTVVDPNCKADLLIIATNTRSLPEAEASHIMADLTIQLMLLKPKLIFKKIDSVLRGHILNEIESQLAVSGLKRTLIIPGNPLHEKKIVDGIYYYRDEPIHLSDYANDPVFPAITSNVKEMLRAANSINLLKTGEELPETGIMVGEVCDEIDLNYWVEQADGDTLLAGASGLFNNLLQHLFPAQPAGYSYPGLPGRRLFVFGSTFYQGKLAVNNGFMNNIAVHYVPAAIIGSDDDKQIIFLFASHVATSIIKQNNAIIAINPESLSGVKIDPVLLSHKIAAIVKQVIQYTTLNELLIEGGATAWSVLNRLNVKKLLPVTQLAPGVIRMSIPGDTRLYVTLKPGSYEWPAPVWVTN